MTLKLVSNLMFAISCLFLAVYAFFVFYQPIELGDVWWHLATGRWIFEHGWPPHFDIFAFDEPQAGISPQWLGSLNIFLIYHVFGFEGLKIFRALIFCLALILIVFVHKRYIPGRYLTWLVLLVIAGMSTRVLIRPFIVNFLFIQFFLITLFSRQRHNSSPALYLGLLLLGILWHNLHLGAFIYGISLITIFLVSSVVELTMEKKSNGVVSDHLLKRFKWLFITWFLYFGVFFIGPYGIEGGLYPYRIFLDKDFIQFGLLKSFIAELQPPYYLLSIKGIWFYVLSGATMISIFLTKYDRLLRGLLFLLALILFLYALRAVGLYVLVCVYIIGEHFKNAVRKGHLLIHEKNLKDIISSGVLILVLMFLSPRLMFAYAVVDGRVRGNSEIDVSVSVPQEMLVFLKDNNLTGHSINSSAYGGYLHWQAYPEIKAFSDNRQYHLTQYLIYRDLLSYPQDVVPYLLAKNQVRLALLDGSHAASQKLMKYLNEDQDWHLIWIKGNSMIFIHEKYLEKQNGSIRTLKENYSLAENVKNDILDIGLFDVPSLNLKPSWLFPEPYYIEDLQEGITLFEMGYLSKALPKIQQGARFLGEERMEALTQSIKHQLRMRGALPFNDI